MSYIVFDHINKYFGTNHVLKDISLEIEKGDFVTLLGPSGCGKSTLLRCLSGLEPVTEGRIILDGEDITEKEPKDRSVGMIFQQYSLFPNMNVFQNIAFGLKLKKIPKEMIEKKVREAVTMVELSGKESHYPSQLSGGQQQRVALARSIAAEPKVLLLDEPLSAIDAKLRRSLQARIREIHKELGLTSVFVTHDQDEAMILSDVIHLFNSGTIEQSDKPVDLYTTPRSSYAAGFIGHYNLLEQEEFVRLTAAEGCLQAQLGNSGINAAGGVTAVGEVAASEVAGEGAGCIAIRPETIELSADPQPDSDKLYQFQAVIMDYVIHGNVLRYRLAVRDVELKADVLFRSFQLFEKGESVYASVAKHNCLQIR